ncbi:hypothetical protein [Paenibacillus sp. FSL H8-0283]|uniref:hypothetical protein n=1 Tax=Paenibacillus sp. FSL H8-0283 TaxID=2921383 RepID=UPI00324C2018
MMLNLRLAKKKMEKEEGMNHLWIELTHTNNLNENAILRIHLPNGLYRGLNLNGNFETETGEIKLLSRDKDVFIEFYTQSRIDCDEALINVELCYQSSHLNWKGIKQDITVRFVDEEDVDDEHIDHQVIERVMKLEINSSSKAGSDSELLVIRPRTYQTRDSEYAYLEKDYRINY